MKSLTIFTPTYNRLNTLGRTYNSLVQQTCHDFIWLVIDDGSTDGCGELCDHYAALDPRIKVIHQKNRGLSGARNAGLDVCKGDFIAFLDA